MCCSSPATSRISPPSARSPRSPTASACRAEPAPSRSPACTAASPAPPTRCPMAGCTSRSRSDPTRCRSTAGPATSSASTAPSSRRSSSCAATTAGSRRSCAASPSPARWPTPAATRPDLSYEQKVELLQTVDVTERLELALGFQRERLAEMQVRKRIRDDVESGAEKQQREYFLRKQMESIRKELGEDDASVVEEYRTKIDEAGMPDARARAGREGARPPRAGRRAERRVERDPHLPRLADRGAVERSARRSGSIPSTRVRCSTPTTPASRTSRTGSSSTSRSRSCARSAGSPRTSAPARSSP